MMTTQVSVPLSKFLDWMLDIGVDIDTFAEMKNAMEYSEWNKNVKLEFATWYDLTLSDEYE